MDTKSFDLLKSTVADMDTINNSIQDSLDINPSRVLEPVLGEIDFDKLSHVTQAKLSDLVSMYLTHFRSALEGEMELKALDIQQLKS